MLGCHRHRHWHRHFDDSVDWYVDDSVYWHVNDSFSRSGSVGSLVDNRYFDRLNDRRLRLHGLLHDTRLLWQRVLLEQGDVAQGSHQLLAHRVQMLLSNHLVLLEFQFTLCDKQIVLPRVKLILQCLHLY